MRDRDQKKITNPFESHNVLFTVAAFKQPFAPIESQIGKHLSCNVQIAIAPEIAKEKSVLKIGMILDWSAKLKRKLCFITIARLFISRSSTRRYRNNSRLSSTDSNLFWFFSRNVQHALYLFWPGFFGKFRCCTGSLRIITLSLIVFGGFFFSSRVEFIFSIVFLDVFNVHLLATVILAIVFVTLRYVALHFIISNQTKVLSPFAFCTKNVLMNILKVANWISKWMNDDRG